MPFSNQDLMTKLVAREEELGPRGFQPIPKGHYVAKFIGGEVIHSDGRPILKPEVEIIECAPDVEDAESIVGKTVSDMWSWHVAETSQRSNKPYETRLANARHATERELNAIIYQMMGHPDGDEGTADELYQAINNLPQADDDYTETEEVMEELLNLLEGIEVVVYVSQRTGSQGGVFNGFRVYSNTGKDDSPFEESWEAGLEKVGIVSEEALASI